MKKYLIPCIALVLIAAQGCGLKGSQADEAAPFETYRVGVADSLSTTGGDVTVKIEGEYPSEANVTADSVRLWLAKQLSTSAGYSGAKLFDVTAANVADGNALVAECCDSLMAGARRDFIDFAENGFAIQYEYDIKFGVSFMSAKILTCYLTAYGYQGGAHGGVCFENATFDRGNGVILTYDNVFKPECRGRLLDMIKEGIWTQYFEPDDADSSLADVLLIKPEDMQLPMALPDFGEGGVVFTYHQYEIAPYAAGMPSCLLTYRQLEPLMRPEVIGLLPKSY